MKNSAKLRFLRRVWQEEDGVLTFEWVLLLTLLAIGIVGGLAAVRDAIISELGDAAGAIVNIDQSYSVIEFENEDANCPIAAPGWQSLDTPGVYNVSRPEQPDTTS